MDLQLLKTRLEQREVLLRMLDRMRAENGNPHFGWTLERTILDLELADLETAMAIQAASEQTLTPRGPTEL